MNAVTRRSMSLALALAAGMGIVAPLALTRCSATQAGSKTYLGFDCNEYPGDANLALLRRTFSFSGYWLNNPPGANNNSWAGTRKVLQAAGFGFLVVFNGRTDAQIKAAADPAKLGRSDAAAAVAAARAEGFPSGTIIFLDQEEGGRLLEEQRIYLHSWADGVTSVGYEAGVYCSGIPFRESAGVTLVTAEDIRQNAGGRKLHYWVANDVCPPSPGCVFPRSAPDAASSRVAFAEVWQFTQSPRRHGFTRNCPDNWSKDGKCYPPGVDRAQHIHVDIDAAGSNDPSHGRTQD